LLHKNVPLPDGKKGARKEKRLFLHLRFCNNAQASFAYSQAMNTPNCKRLEQFGPDDASAGVPQRKLGGSSCEAKNFTAFPFLLGPDLIFSVS
jgi:hypothetical protein